MNAAVTALDRLAALCGVEPAYTDIWNRRHEVGDDTKRALLRAMGVAALNDIEAADSLAAAEVARREQVLPAVTLTDAGAAAAVALADTGSGRRFTWSLETEDGTVHEGGGSIDELDVTSTGADAVPRCRHLTLGVELPPGYHRLEVEGFADGPATTTIISAPRRAFGCDNLGAAKSLWGLTVPLYGLRSGRNWGIGDFDDLGAFAEVAAEAGAALVGINPVHALFHDMPDRISPYSPSSRLHLNPLHIAIEDVPELSLSEDARSLMASVSFRDELQRARTGDEVDYGRVAALKRRALEQMFRAFQDSGNTGTRRRLAFEAFVRNRGDNLTYHAVFEALSEHFHQRDAAIRGWRDWPAPYRDPRATAVADFAREFADRVAFFKYLQWLADDQLEAAQNRARRAQMPIGLYLDLAVGVSPDGADSWSDQDSIVRDVHLGAPPDHFNPEGQDWGLAPYNPRVLRDRGYAPFIDLLRASMRGAGALRIDHALGLSRSFWVPDRLTGAYVKYPFDELLAVIRLESHRHGCVVIGEDLGNVPDGFRDRQEAAGLLGYRVLQFEREHHGGFRRSADYSAQAVASVGTHDLPTLAGFWAGRDIDRRAELGLIAEAGQAEDERRARESDRRALLELLASEGLLPAGFDPRQPPETVSWSIVTAIHRFLARTPCIVVLVQLIDALGIVDQENLPGTIDEYPNWRRRLPLTIDELAADDRLQALAAAVSAARTASFSSSPPDRAPYEPETQEGV